MRVLIFHGYLLRGTGSNIYNASLAQALCDSGNHVDLICQERHPENLDFVGRYGDWDGGELQLTGDPDALCTVYRPDIAGLLPVYVADKYEGVEARPFPELSDSELDRYIELNVAAVQEVVELNRPDFALANHLVMGPTILARALADAGIPIVTKIHGSDLEYTVRPHLERFIPFANESVNASTGVMVGSSHIAEILWDTVQVDDLPAKTWLGPPGVDIARFKPLPKTEAWVSLREVTASIEGDSSTSSESDSTFTRDPAAVAEALRGLDPKRPLVVFVGKFLVSKGVDLLLAAWPLVLQRVPNAQLAFIGFGAFESALRDAVGGLALRDIGPLSEIARRGRGLEGGESSPLPYLVSFLDGLRGAGLDDYLATAGLVGDSVTIIGRLEHDELAGVLSAADAMVVPSTFPEAFGMVSIEAAACGVLPIAARHSGLEEVANQLASSVAKRYRSLLSFNCDDSAVEGIAERLVAWFTLPLSDRQGVTMGDRDSNEGLVELVRRRFSWQGVATTLIAAAEGDKALLTAPATRIDYGG